MGAVTVSECLYNNNVEVEEEKKPPLILGLEPAALVDHVARIDSSFLNRIPGRDRGGSTPVSIEELEYILREVKYFYDILTVAGGSVTNTIRGLAAGFGVSCGLVGCYGDDEQGHLFVTNMRFNGVDVSRLRQREGATGRCVCLVDASSPGSRTMRPSLSKAVTLQADELNRKDFKGSKWLHVRFGVYNLGIIKTAIRIAKQEGVSISMDLASFETVRDCRPPLVELLESGDIDLCFANQDEARELMRGSMDDGDDQIPGAALDFLGQKCKWAVVTLGANGCVAKHGEDTVRVAATRDGKAILDATGAGDLFVSGFLYGLVKGLSLEECCKVGSCSGGAVVRSLGGEVTPENWQWMDKQMEIQNLSPPLTNITSNWSSLKF